MKPLLTILQKIIVNPFYRDNTGFFFFWGMLLVALQTPASRLFTEPFLSSVIQTPVILAGILAALLLYFSKCLTYTTQKLTEPEQEFLLVAALLPVKLVAGSWLLVFGSIYLPAIGYLGLLAWSAAGVGAFGIVAGILLYTFILAGFFVVRATRRLRGFSTTIKYTRWPFWGWLPQTYRYLTIFIRYILHEARSLTLLTKLFCGAVTFAFIYLYPVPEYGARPAATGWLIGLAGHSLLVFRLRTFEEEKLLLLRQLPFELGPRLLLPITTYAFMLLPEGVYFLSLVGERFNGFTALGFYCFGVAFLGLLHSWLYRAAINQERYFRQLFYLFIFLLFLILFSVPLAVLAAGCLGGSLFLIRRYYYSFEIPW